MSEYLTRFLLKYKLYNTYYNSDHEIIKKHFNLMISETTYTPCFLFKSIFWEKIREDIRKDLEYEKLSILPLDLNEYISQLLTLITSFRQK